jgi:hypothetical protein
VPQPQYDVAKALTELAGAARQVLAPEGISEWVPTLRRRAYPVVSRRTYFDGMMRLYGHRIDVNEANERLELFLFVSGMENSRRVPEILARWVDTGRIDAVAAARELPWLCEVARPLHAAGFTTRQYEEYLLFYRPDPIRLQAARVGVPFDDLLECDPQ